MTTPLDEVPSWEPELHAIESHEYVEADGDHPGDMQGASNRLPRQLGNRTLWLHRAQHHAELVTFERGYSGAPLDAPRAAALYVRSPDGFGADEEMTADAYNLRLPTPSPHEHVYSVHVTNCTGRSIRLIGPSGEDYAEVRSPDFARDGDGDGVVGPSHEVYGLACTVSHSGVSATQTAGRSFLSVASVEPPAVPAYQPTAVRLRGTGFAGLTTLRVGAEALPPEVVSDLEVVVWVVPSALGLAPGDTLQFTLARSGAAALAAPPVAVVA